MDYSYTSSFPEKKTRHPLSTVARRRKTKTRRNQEKTVALNFHGRLPRPDSDIRRPALEAAGDSKSLSSSTNGLDRSSSFSTALGGDEKKIISSEELCGFVDEEAIFNMPLVVDSMAERMLLTPPALKKGFNWTQERDGIGFNLWTEDKTFV